MKIVVLSDKKPGHFKQSLGIVQKMKDCSSEWIDIQFKSKWRDNILRILMCIFGGIHFSSSLIHIVLKWCLDQTSYNSVYFVQEADLILSTGSSVASVNLLLGKILNAKTVTCLRPSPIGIRYFDLAILPMLNWKKSRREHNVCKTTGIPNPISPDILNSEREILLNVLKLKDQKRIGILLGGSDKHETISLTDAKQLLQFCKETVNTHNAQILLTTSRRTPLEVTDLLNESLTDEEWCPLYVDPNSPTEIDDPYQAILALSDILIVSADSFSMVCEAASSGKRVYVIRLTHKTRHLPKRYKVYQYLEEHSYITLCTLEELHEHKTDATLFHSSSAPLQDTDIAVGTIRTMISKYVLF